MFRRLVGLVIFVVGLLGIVAAYLVVTTVPAAIEKTAVSTDEMFATVSRNLDTIEETLLIGKETLTDVHGRVIQEIIA